jgi:GR25 family glycosyltransferase involved in LPS biosynthesis
MLPSKAYILRIDDPRSIEYSKTTAESCDKIGLPYEFVDGLNFKKHNYTPDQIWKHLKNSGVAVPEKSSAKGAGACATIGHYLIWKKIADNEECAIVLEHDAIMLNLVNIQIPDNSMVCLGYKIKDPQNYNNESVIKQFSEQKIESRKYHGGAHAYAITFVTARKLLNNLNGITGIGNIDNAYFLGGKGREGVSLNIIDPVASLGWLRESTIWNKSAVDNYSPILDSFKNNYKSKEDFGLKTKG